MKITELKEIIKIGYQIKRPLLITSSPGIGKSAICRQVADELGISFIDIRVSQKAPEELSSIAYVDNGTVKYAKPSWVPESGAGIILLDEFMDSSLHVQSAMLEFILDRRIGGSTLGENWYVVAAGNRQEDKASACRLSTAQANRFIHISLEADAECVINYGLENNWNSIVLYFLKYKSGMVSTFDPRGKENAFASPRTWEYASDILNIPNLKEEMRLPLLSGAIGNGAAIELEGFLQVYKELPSYDIIIAAPNDISIPEKVGSLFAVCALITRNFKAEQFETVMKYVGRMHIEYQVMVLDSIRKKFPKIVESSSFVNWAVKNQSFFI